MTVGRQSPFDRLGLNAAQLRAVMAPPGHLLINAAAGTGKTSTMAARILYLQSEVGLDAESIVAVSFSRAARSQLDERMRRYANELEVASPVLAYTFHGLAYRIVRLASVFGETRLRPGFQIVVAARNRPNPIIEAHATHLFRDVNGDFGAETVRLLYPRGIDLLRQKGYVSPREVPHEKMVCVPGEFQARIEVPANDLIRMWEIYQVILERENAIDYVGLVTEAIKALSHPGGATLARLQVGLRCMIVDEFQDTSRAMLRLLLTLAGRKAFLNVVGDDDQTIYGFNGSDVTNIRNFFSHVSNTAYPILEPVDLTENYRSCSNVLAMANRVISVGGDERRKTLEPATGSLPEPLNLYRTRNCPVRLVHAPRLELAADYIAHEVQRLAREERIPVREIAVLVRKDTKHSPQGETVRQRLNEMGIGTAAVDRDPQQAAAVMEATCQLCNYHYTDVLAELITAVAGGECDEELSGISREEIGELLSQAQKAGAQHAWQAAEYLFDSVSAEAQEPESDGVQIRTVHSAKGQEFRVVFLMYLQDTQFPHGKKPDIEEERRLLYVGITRAQERLYVLGHTGTRGQDFFGDCDGDGVMHVEWTVIGGVEAGGSEGTDSERLAAIDRAARMQAAASQDEREDVSSLFDDDPF